MKRSMKEYVTVWEDGKPTTLRWAAPVVRCRDCAHYATDELGDYCTLLDFQDAKGMEDRFCAWGERRGE